MGWSSLGRIVAVVAAVLGLLFAFAASEAQALSLEGKVVCIDPGHGGAESGAVYQKRGRGGWTLVEKEINLDVAHNLRGKLEAAGASVVMTRSDDSTLSLELRVQVCNAAGADLTVSVHTNSTFSSRWDGAMTLMNKTADRPLAEAMQPVMYGGLKAGWDGRFTDYGINVDEWYIPKHTTMPAVILEPVFMSNDSEAQALRATTAQALDGRRAQIARVEYEGILAYFAAQ